MQSGEIPSPGESLIPILDAGRSDDWVQVWSASFEAVQLTPKTYTPIPLITVPLAFDSRTLLVGATSRSAKPSWRYACTLYPSINVPSIGAAAAPRVGCTLGLSIHQLEVYSNPYTLKIKIPYWFVDMELEIWKYVGQDTTDTDKNIARIETKIDTLLSR